jgi:hypothetical protein
MAGTYLYVFKSVDPTIAYVTYGVLNVNPIALLLFYYVRRIKENRGETIREKLIKKAQGG